MSDAERCHVNGWVVGTHLEGDEGYGPTVIKITAIGEDKILARSVSHQGVLCHDPENSWTLRLREWRTVPEPREVFANHRDETTP